MANDKDLTIGLKATGADAAAAEIDKAVAAEKRLDQSEVKITDTAKANTTALNENKAAFAAWQKERQAAAQAAGSSSTATAMGGGAAANAEKETAQAAARLANEKAMAEAQSIRFARAAEAATAQAEADLEQVLAARTTLALEEAKSAEILKRAISRAVLPESRMNEAGRMLFKNEGALAMAGTAVAEAAMVWGPITLAVGAGAVAFHLASKEADGLSASCKQLGISTTELDRAAHPIANVFGEAKKMAGELGHALLNTLTLGTLNATEATIKEANAHVQAAEAQNKNLDAAVKLHAEMANRAGVMAIQNELAQEKLLGQQLSDNLELLKSRDTLAANRDKRAGLSSGEQAVNAVNRQTGEDARARQIAEQVVDVASKKYAQALADLSAAATPEEKTRLEGVAIAMKGEMDVAAQKLSTLASEQSLKLTDSAEAASATVVADQAARNQKIAAAIVEKLDAIQEAQGGALSAGMQQVRAQAQKIAQAATGSDAEGKNLYNQLERLRQSNEGRSQEAQQTVSKLETDLKTSAATTKKELAQLPVTVAEQATQISAAQQTANDQTVQTIQTLAPTPQHAAAIDSAAKQTDEAIQQLGNLFITSFASLTAGIGQIVNRQAQQDAQINQLFSRLR